MIRFILIKKKDVKIKDCIVKDYGIKYLFEKRKAYEEGNRILRKYFKR